MYDPVRPKTKKADPGPGAYDPRRINSSLSGIMSKTSRPEIKNDNPPPGAYETHIRTDFKKVTITPRDRFGKDGEEFKGKPPGPADYHPTCEYLST